MEGWIIADFHFARQLNPRFAHLDQFPVLRLGFCHVTPTKNVRSGFNGSALRATGDDKEYGPGFYTMSVATAASGGDAGVLGQEWFTKKQQQPCWSVLVFEFASIITGWLMEAAGGLYRSYLLHFLMHPAGYPSGGLQPTADDIRAIEHINKRGKVLIFPDDPNTKVDVGGLGKVCAADVQAMQGANLPGEPWLVIGPQKPVYLSARQIVWKAPVGIWMINSATRVCLYNNKL